jgi:succinate-acetate transporter protein
MLTILSLTGGIAPSVRALDFGLTERNAVRVHYANLLAFSWRALSPLTTDWRESLWRLSLNPRPLTPSISIRAASQHEEAPVAEVEAVHNAQVVEEAQLATAPPSGGDPVPLGLLVFALGSTVLGISLLGYVPLAVQGNTIMPIVFAATGLGLLITTTWAVRIGETFVATVLGAFAAFWISYAALVIGLAHNWYAIPPTAILHTIGEFLIAWDIVIFMLFLVSLRIPLLFSLILGAGVVGVTLITIGVLESSAGIQHAGAVFVLVFAALGYYGYLGTALVSVGGKPLPFGKPALSLLSGK